MSDAEIILFRARKIGVALSAEGDRLGIAPARLCPPELLAEVREHKHELLSLLQAAQHLPPDQVPWVHVAKQVLAGEFINADRSTIETLSIGLRRIQHPLCRRAVEHIHPAKHEP